MLISKCKRNHLRTFFWENLKNSKKVWNKIRELISKKQKGRNYIFLSEDGATIREQEIVTNKFNKYFINVAQELLKDLRENNKKFQDYLKHRNISSFFLKEIEADETYKLL